MANSGWRRKQPDISLTSRSTASIAGGVRNWLQSGGLVALRCGTSKRSQCAPAPRGTLSRRASKLPSAALNSFEFEIPQAEQQRALPQLRAGRGLAQSHRIKAGRPSRYSACLVFAGSPSVFDDGHLCTRRKSSTLSITSTACVRAVSSIKRSSIPGSRYSCISTRRNHDESFVHTSPSNSSFSPPSQSQIRHPPGCSANLNNPLRSSTPMVSTLLDTLFSRAISEHIRRARSLLSAATTFAAVSLQAKPTA